LLGGALADDEKPYEEPIAANYLDDLNPTSKKIVRAYVERALTSAPAQALYQFERHGYFIRDDDSGGASEVIFNRAVTLRDSWAKSTR